MLFERPDSISRSEQFLLWTNQFPVLIATLTAVDCNFHLEIIMFDLQVGI